MPEDQNSQPPKMGGLYVSQFLGAFNDNAWQKAVVFMGAATIAAQGGESFSEPAMRDQQALATALLTAPLCLFSPIAGMISDRISKTSMIRSMKFVEILLMGTGAIFLAMGVPASWLMGIIVLMGIQSSLFSPAKYGILPEVLPGSKLSHANGLLELWTISAIILGIAAGGILKNMFVDKMDMPVLIGVVLTVLAIVGWRASKYVPDVPAARQKGGIGVIKEAFKAITGSRILMLTIAGLSLFWFTASLLQINILVYMSKRAQHFGDWADSAAAGSLALVGIGIAVGSLAAARISGRGIETGLVPVGAVFMSSCTAILGWCDLNYLQSCGWIVGIGLGGGLILVPLNAQLQHLAPASARGAVIALANCATFGAVVLGAGVTIYLGGFNWSTEALLRFGAVVMIGGTAWALWLKPEELLRLCLVFLRTVFYRIKTIDADKIPNEGGALLVPNHVSFIDWLFLISLTPRPIRFVIDSGFYHHPLFHPFLKMVGAIPISPSGGPKVVMRALRDAGNYLDKGELVCIFAEGQITRTGMMQPFRRGLERIVKGRAAPIIPVYLDRLWGSLFSFEGGKPLFKFPRKWPYPVTISVGEPLPPETDVSTLRKAVHDLSTQAWENRQRERDPLHYNYIQSCRRHPFKVFIREGDGPPLRRFKALVTSIALARHLVRSDWNSQHHVGILLPPGKAGVLANMAAALGGHVSVNLNYTTGAAGLESSIRQAGLSTVLTSKVILEKLDITLPEGIRPIWIEDVMTAITKSDRLKAAWIAMPFIHSCKFIERHCGSNRPIVSDDLATIIFSSGSTGEPKGIMLTHGNLDSNVEAVRQVLSLRGRDNILGILPLFHSFGTLVTWLAANHSLTLICHPNPVDAAAIGDLVERWNATLLIATPTFLQLYQRRCSPAQFGSLRFVLTGAEKLAPRLADDFEKSFGVRPIEGYGMTECSPAVCVSTTDRRGQGFFQPGSRKGSVGQALPGISLKVTDPETGDALGVNEAGMLWVRGSNVMRGYLGQPELTAKAIVDGWYKTGDIAKIDEDGFVFITDRLSRFSKIGGEMVPHGKVEMAIHEAADAAPATFAVTAIPDERKGEKLIVLHIYEGDISELVEKLGTVGLPNLFIPRKDAFHKIESLPVLGTGKLDLKGLKQMAKDLAATT